MALIGMNRETGQPMTGVEHLKQSIKDILTTRKGARRERPEYGSDLPLMVDLPANKGLISAMQAEAARAIGRWEPRIKIDNIRCESIINGTIQFRISGIYDGNPLIFEVSA